MSGLDWWLTAALLIVAIGLSIDTIRLTRQTSRLLDEIAEEEAATDTPGLDDERH